MTSKKGNMPCHIYQKPEQTANIYIQNSENCGGHEFWFKLEDKKVLE